MLPASKTTNVAYEDTAADQASEKASRITFDAPDLGAWAEQLSQYDLDHLPFGAILLDRAGIVKFYSATEARQSGFGIIPIGWNLFNIATSFSGDGFRGRIERAMENGPVDLEFGWPHDYANPAREVRIRVLSSRSGGIWLFIERDQAEAQQAAAG